MFQINAALRLKAAVDSVGHVKKMGYGPELKLAVEELAPRVNMTRAELESRVDLGWADRKMMTFQLTKEEAAKAKKILTNETGASIKVPSGVQWDLNSRKVIINKYSNAKYLPSDRTWFIRLVF